MKPKQQLQKRKYGGVQADLRTEERKNRIISAGLEGFGTDGYAKTSIKKICTLAGLTERYFYESFKCKEDLLSAVYQSIIEELIKNTQAIIDEATDNPMETASKALKIYFQTLQDNPWQARVMLFEVLGVSPRIDMEYQAATRKLENIVMEILSIVLPDVDQKQLKETYFPTAIAGAIIMVAHRWTLDNFITPLDKLLPQATSLFNVTEGLLPNIMALKRKKR